MRPSFLPGRNSVIGGLSVLSVAATGCSASEAPPKTHVDVVTDLESSALHEDRVRAVNGTYGADCGERSGSFWSLPVGESDTALDHPLLSMIPRDSGCVLTLTDLVTAGELNEETPLHPRFDPPIALSASWATEQSRVAMDDAVVYANARVERDVDAGLAISLTLSDHETDTGGTVRVGDVEAPDYELRMGGPNEADALELTVDAHEVVTSVSGAATLVEGARRGDHYVVDLDTLPHSDAPRSAEVLARAYDAGEAYALDVPNPRVPAERFGLVGEDVSSGVMRTIIVAHIDHGVRSFQSIRVTFRGPG